MGTWGTDLFADDVACDVRDHYRESLEDGVDDATATARTLDAFRAELEEADGVALLALAVTQSKLGRLDPAIRARAIAVLDRGADLDAWERDAPKLAARRRTALERARAQLEGAQPARKRLRAPTRPRCGLVAGDVLGLEASGRVGLLRVVLVRSHRRGETPVLEELAWDGAGAPPPGVLAGLPPRSGRPLGLASPLDPDTRVSAFVMQGVDWEAAGFRKVGTIPARDGDATAPMPSSGVSWATLAEQFLRRAGA
ncbi:MAG: hypothetical protein U0667_04425 [Chloroflexota bacterium]